MAFGRETKEQKAERERQQAAENAGLREAHTLAVEQHINESVAAARATVASGSTVTLVMDLYVPVDAQMNTLGSPTGLDLSQVNYYTFAGWRIVSAVPRTYGGFTSYKVSKTTAYGVSGWGKDTHQVGLGGHVIGVYLLMTLDVTAANFDQVEGTVREVAARYLPPHLSGDPELSRP